MLPIPVETIVASLAAQHTLLNQEIAAFHQVLQRRQLDDIRRALERINQLLVAHCKFEDEQFYPQLLEKLKGNSELLHTVSLFHGNLGRIGDGFFAFLSDGKFHPKKSNWWPLKPNGKSPTSCSPAEFAMKKKCSSRCVDVSFPRRLRWRTRLNLH